jgi:mannose-6-phosphate isomerase
LSVGLVRPLELNENRVARFYRGGALLDAFRGSDRPADDARPEDWVGSVTSAWQPPGSPRTDEGISRVEVDGRETSLRDLLIAAPEDVAGAEFVSTLAELGEGSPRATTGLLVKLLDSAVRLPVHCHPTRRFARRHLGSFFGKTEAWLVLATRQIPGQDPPHVRVGFRRAVGRDELRGWIEEQNTTPLLNAMHRRGVSAGDVWLVPAGLPHAIGAGVFLVELQEPADFSIVAETAGFPIAMEDAHLGLGWDVMIDAFDRTGLGDAGLEALRLRPTRPARDDAGRPVPLLGAAADPFFRAYRMVVRGEAALAVAPTFAVGVVLSGRGEIRTRDAALPVGRGSTFALPAAAIAARTTVLAPDGIELLLCLPPEPTTASRARDRPV